MDLQKEVIQPIIDYFQQLEIYGIIGWSLILIAVILLIIGIII